MRYRELTRERPRLAPNLRFSRYILDFRHGTRGTPINPFLFGALSFSFFLSPFLTSTFPHDSRVQRLDSPSLAQTLKIRATARAGRQSNPFATGEKVVAIYKIIIYI